MDWYYTSSDEKQGPITAVELLSLKDRGELIGSSLVWTDGMSDWVAFDKMRIKIIADALDLNPDLVQCAFSGKLIARDRALEYGDQHILPEHKDQFVQQLAEGHTPTFTPVIDEYGSDLTFPSVLRRSWDIYRKHFILLALIHFTVWFPLDQLNAFMDATVFAELEEMKSIQKSINFERLLNSMIGIIATSAFFHVCIRHTAGQKPTYGSALQMGLKLWGKMWVTRFIQGFFLIIGVLTCMIPLFIIMSAGAGTTHDLFTISLILIALILPVLLWFVSRIAFTLPYLAETGVWGFAAMKKSFFLTKGRVWRIIGYYTLIGLIAVIPILIPVIPSSFPPLDSVFPSGLLATLSGILASFFVVFTYAFYKQIRISIGEDGLDS